MTTTIKGTDPVSGKTYLASVYSTGELSVSIDNAATGISFGVQATANATMSTSVGTPILGLVITGTPAALAAGKAAFLSVDAYKKLRTVNWPAETAPGHDSANDRVKTIAVAATKALLLSTAYTSATLATATNVIGSLDISGYKSVRVCVLNEHGTRALTACVLSFGNGTYFAAANEFAAGFATLGAGVTLSQNFSNEGATHLRLRATPAAGGVILRVLVFGLV